jgi:hypothetical protein
MAVCERLLYLIKYLPVTIMSKCNASQLKLFGRVLVPLLYSQYVKLKVCQDTICKFQATTRQGAPQPHSYHTILGTMATIGSTTTSAGKIVCTA